QEHAVSANE
nr:immunoglobulin heavy chain junction region [Homo sapiens]